MKESAWTELILAVHIVELHWIGIFRGTNFRVGKQDFSKEILGFFVWAFNRYFFFKCEQSKIMTQKWISTLKWKSIKKFFFAGADFCAH